jgi:hypothetical protein
MSSQVIQRMLGGAARCASIDAAAAPEALINARRVVGTFII